MDRGCSRILVRARGDHARHPAWLTCDECPAQNRAPEPKDGHPLNPHACCFPFSLERAHLFARLSRSVSWAQCQSLLSPPRPVYQISLVVHVQPLVHLPPCLHIQPRSLSLLVRPFSHFLCHLRHPKLAV